MLSIILVTYRSWELLEENIDHLLQSSGLGREDPIPWELIIVNNDADEDRDGAVAFKRKFPRVRMLQAFGDRGYGYSCNRGAEVAKGDAFLFGGSDLKMEGPQLQILLKGLRDYPDYAILSAPQDDRRGRLQRSFAPFTRLGNHFSFLRWFGRRFQPGRHLDPRTPPEELPEMLPVEWVSGSLVLIRRESFEQLGGWDEDLWLYCEDEDLCRRAHENGMRVGYYTPPRFIHAHAVSTRGTVQETAVYKSETIISKLIYLTKHEPNPSGDFLRYLIRLQTHIGLPLFETLSLLTARSIDKIELKKHIHRRLKTHYKIWRASGQMLSEYAPNHPERGRMPVEEIEAGSPS